MCAQVTLVLPWLSVEEQSIVFPDHLTFSRPEQQEAHLKEVCTATGQPKGKRQTMRIGLISVHSLHN